MTFKAGTVEYEDALEAVERLQALMIDRAEKQLGEEEQAEYRAIRRALMRAPEYQSRLPKLVRLNGDLGAIWSELRDFSGQWEPRRMFVREQMRDVIQFAMEEAAREASISASTWTGIQSPKERLLAARKILPLARAAVEGLIAELERPQGNGGPPLDHRQEAIDQLRALHSVLGECLDALEAGRGSLREAALKEANGYAARAAKALKDDPMPYLVAGSIAGLLGLLGVGELGGFLSGIALTFQKNAK